MKTMSCFMLFALVWMMFLTFSSGVLAEEGDTLTDADNEIVQQAPAPVYLTEEETGDQDTEENISE